MPSLLPLLRKDSQMWLWQRLSPSQWWSSQLLMLSQWLESSQLLMLSPPRQTQQPRSSHRQITPSQITMLVQTTTEKEMEMETQVQAMAAKSQPLSESAICLLASPQTTIPILYITKTIILSYIQSYVSCVVQKVYPKSKRKFLRKV